MTNLKDMSNEEFVHKYIAIYVSYGGFGKENEVDCSDIRDELLTRLELGEKAIKELKMAKETISSPLIPIQRLSNDDILETPEQSSRIDIDTLENINAGLNSEVSYLKAELKSAKLDSHRLVWQEKVNEDLACCGNCKHFQCRLDNPKTKENNYCPQWVSDGMTREQREIK